MTTAPMSSRRARAAALLLAGAASLAGCSSVVDTIPTWAGGLPAGTPERPTTAPAFPAVHDMPAARQDVALSEAERAKLRQDLTESRKRAEQAARESVEATAGDARNP